MIKLKRKKNRLFCLPVLSLMITDEIFYNYQLPYLKSNFHTKVWLWTTPVTGLWCISSVILHYPNQILALDNYFKRALSKKIFFKPTTCNIHNNSKVWVLTVHNSNDYMNTLLQPYVNLYLHQVINC